MEDDMNVRTRRGCAVGLGLLLVLGLAPGSAVAQDEAAAITEVGAGEGQISILAWPGYVEDGSTVPEVDWVTPFEDQTGCEVTFDIFGTSDEAWTKFTSGGYDVVSASGDLSFRLFENGYVQPVDLDLIPNYADIIGDLKDQPYNTFNGVHYGVPHGRGANLLMWRTDVVDPAPDSWTTVFDPASPYAGKITAYDAAIYIADAAVVLMATKPELGITNPYALDETQFAEAVALAKQQQPVLNEYWSDYTLQMEAFRNGDSVLGTTWQVITNLLGAEDPPVPVANVKPVEGSTGWSDTWMIAADAANVNCSYLWLDYVASPPVQAAIAEWFGEAPANEKACELTADPGHCDAFHAAGGDPFWNDVWYWTTPREECLDGRTDVQCVGFDRWLDAWLEIKGA
jgi:putative spermidine/putrescine transport system substrate-binding protein